MEQAEQKQITMAFIGAGNMARSLILGLMHDRAPVTLRIADPDLGQLDGLRRHWQETYGQNLFVTTDNREAMAGADIVVLAVKPQVMREVAEGLAAAVQAQPPLFVSVAAGVRVDALARWLGGNVPIVRCMPNTPALVQAGATGLYANAHVSASQRSQAESLLRAVGITLWLDDEAQLDAVTAISGSGPAYFFLVMEAMQAAAQQLGLKAEDAHLLIVQTALGAAKLALESEEPPAELRRKVTSKGGTTEAAIQVLLDGKLPEQFAAALQAAARRARELADLNQ